MKSSSHKTRGKGWEIALAYVVAILMTAISGFGVVSALGAIGKIILVGEICYRSRCLDWSSRPFAMAWELFGDLVVLLIAGGLFVGGISALVNPKWRD